MAKLVSRTYGDALFELALEENKVDEIFEQVTAVRDTFLSNEELLRVLHHPKIPKKDKSTFVNKVFADYVSEEMQGFMHIIIEKDRYDEIIPILEYVIKRVKLYKGIGEAKVVSAVELTAKQKSEVEGRLLATTKYDSFEMTYVTDPAILGGMIIRIEDRVVDSSLKTQLDQMKKQLVQIQL